MSTNIHQLELLEALEEIEASVVELQRCNPEDAARIADLCHGALAATTVIHEYIQQRMGKPS